MTVRELNGDQLDELKVRLFYDYDEMDIEDSDKQIIAPLQYPSQVPDEIVYKYFDGIDFVEEDFCYREEE